MPGATASTGPRPRRRGVVPLIAAAPPSALTRRPLTVTVLAIYASSCGGSVSVGSESRSLTGSGDGTRAVTDCGSPNDSVTVCNAFLGHVGNRSMVRSGAGSPVRMAPNQTV